MAAIRCVPAKATSSLTYNSLWVRPYFEDCSRHYLLHDGLQDESQHHDRSEVKESRHDRVPRVRARPPPLLRDSDDGSQSAPQGLDWYRNSLRIDEDGDVACDFLEESKRENEEDHEVHASKHQRPETLQRTSKCTKPVAVSLDVRRGFVKELHSGK